MYDKENKTLDEAMVWKLKYKINKNQIHGTTIPENHG